MIFFKKTLIYPIFDVESIGDVPRVPRTHLDVVFAQTIHVYYSTPVFSGDLFSRSETELLPRAPLLFLLLFCFVAVLSSQEVCALLFTCTDPLV